MRLPIVVVAALAVSVLMGRFLIAVVLKSMLLLL
jgi:hypothetical protein